MAEQLKDLLHDATGAVAGAGAALAPTVAAPLAFLPLLAGQIIPAFLDRKQREAREWWEEVIREEGAERAVGVEIETRLQDPVAQEVVAEAFRKLLDAVSPDVARALGILTRRYVREQKPLDDFGRGLARLLSDSTSADLVGLRQLVAVLRDCKHQGMLKLRLSALVRGGMGQVAVVTRGPNERERYDYLGEIPGSLRLFWLLKSHGLGFEGASGYLGAASGPQVLHIRKEMAQQIAEVVL